MWLGCLLAFPFFILSKYYDIMLPFLNKLEITPATFSHLPPLTDQPSFGEYRGVE